MTYKGAEIELRPGDGLGEFMSFVSARRGDGSDLRKLFVPPNPEDARWTPRGEDGAQPQTSQHTR